MKVPFSWLKEFVDIDITAAQLEEKLFGCGFEVEEVIDTGKDISGVVVGKVVECEAIPDTHLHVCKVDAAGEALLQICCGADNVRAGGVYPVALQGATVYETAADHETVLGVATIKKGKMRGYASEGMLCSGTELGLNEDLYPGAGYCGLLELPEDAPLGADVKPLVGLDEVVFDISITSNRADCQSILGIAREVAAILDKPLKMPATDYTQTDVTYPGLDITVEAPDLCPRYLGHWVRNITPGVSPAWMRRHLALCGLRSISNIVDITNYVMLEIGQPMHAFDMDTLESHRIIVRRAAEGETITTLDGKTFRLNTQNLVICDGHKPVALAGIMGGLNSEITENTRQLLFESAKFTRDNVRRTARSLGQNTDASAHYEKGISEYTCELGMARALHLIQELDCGEITSSEFDRGAGAPREGKRFTATVSGINDILGIQVPADTVVDILRRLDFRVERDGDTLDVTAPRWREDIEIGEPDLAEEVIREYGYEHIVPTFLKDAAVTNGGLTAEQERVNKLKRVMCAQGFYETSTLAFYADADLDGLRLPEDAPERNAIKIMNPISVNLTTMRTTLAPSMLRTVVENLKRGNSAGRIFEFGSIYVPKALPVTELPLEVPHLGFALFGDNEDFFTAKGAVEALGAAFHVKFDYERAADVSWLHPGVSARILVGNTPVGVFGKLSNEIGPTLDLPKDSKGGGSIYLGEIDYAALSELFPSALRYEPISDFPDVDRDLSLVVDENVTCGQLVSVIRGKRKAVKSVELFDVYRGKQVGEGKKSMSFKIVFTPSDKALEPKELDHFIKGILFDLKAKLNADIR